MVAAIQTSDAITVVIMRELFQELVAPGIKTPLTVPSVAELVKLAAINAYCDVKRGLVK